MKKKRLISILATVMFAITLVAPLVATPVLAGDPSDWYTSVNGVLSKDYYSLYPYEEKPIDVGLSKFGEMINPNPDGSGNGLGLQYPGYDVVGTYDQMEDTSRDPFANEYINPNLWLNGWFCDVRYTHKTLRDRRVQTMAMYADMAMKEGDWICGHGWTVEGGHTYDLSLAPHGGRKTTGIAVTEPLKVLYHGPRRYVAISNTTICDWEDTNLNGVVDEDDWSTEILKVLLTFIFNKDKKEVVILKDIKILITGKELASPLDVQFSNREEWDLGPGPECGSYAYFWYQDHETCYGPDWHLAPALMREFIAEGKGLREVPVEYDGLWFAPIVPGSVRLYFNGEFKNEGIDYTINYENGIITPIPGFDITADDKVKVVYKLVKETTATATYTEEGQIDTITWNGIEDNYDVAQIISSDKEYVGWKAFWPTLSDYTPNGWEYAFKPLIDIDDEDMVIEPEFPFIIGEWDFMLGKQYPEQFRGVEVVGVTDWNDADDEDFGYPATNQIDKEAMFQLDEYFNPWDLRKAMEKDTMRWVQKEWGDGVTSDFYLEYTDMFPGYMLGDHVPIDALVDKGEWDQYCSFAERVLVDGVLQVNGTDYVMTDDGMYVRVHFVDPPAEDALIKILFSTQETAFTGAWEWLVVGRDSAAVDSAGAAMLSELAKSRGMPVRMSGLDMQDAIWGSEVPYVMSWLREDVDPEDDFIQVRPDPTALEPSRAHYRDDIFGPCHGRSALRDDWCCHCDKSGEWLNGLPIASSNMITIGSPWSNHLTEYFNEFTDAYHDVGTGDSMYPGKFVALPCWNKNTYQPTWEADGNQLTGYAVISTYKDLNGTVGLSIYGWTGQDTYYACWSLIHKEVLFYPIESYLPPGMTAAIVEFNYTLHPTDYCFVSVVETLGTISEFDAQGALKECFPTADNASGGFYGRPSWPETWIEDKFPPIHPDP